LVLTHGYADVERGSAVSSDILTVSRTDMTAQTLNVVLTKDAVKMYDPVTQHPQSVPLTPRLLHSYKLAHASY
jgi:hypothetical protein